MQCATGHTPAPLRRVARKCRDIAKRTLAVRAYWLAADAPPIGAAVPLLMAAGPPVPAVPAVSFEPERLHPTVPPASAAINTAVITFLSTGSIILSSRVGRVARFIVGKKRNHFDEMCGRRSLQARTQKSLTTIRMRTRHGDNSRPFAALVQLAITCKKRAAFKCHARRRIHWFHCTTARACSHRPSHCLGVRSSRKRRPRISVTHA